MKYEDNYEINSTNKENSQSEETKKSNKIQVANIIVGGIVTIISTLMMVFSGEIQNMVYNNNIIKETAEQVLPSGEEVLSDDFTDSEITTNKTETDKENKTETNEENKTETNEEDKTITETKAITPKVSLGTEVNSIEYLQIESDNIFVNSNANATIETFYDGFEKVYGKKYSQQEVSYNVFKVEGYGLCCTIPLINNGDLYFSGEICDCDKVSIGQDESHEKYKFQCFMATEETNQMILGFSLQKPLAKGTYFCLFKINDSKSKRSENIYIKFKIK